MRPVIAAISVVRLLPLLLVLALSACAGGAAAPGTEPEWVQRVRFGCSIANVFFVTVDTIDLAKPGLVTAENKRWVDSLKKLANPICSDPARVLDPDGAVQRLQQIGDALKPFIDALQAKRAP